jgi:single-stranded-DNA-specific exonuclease
LHELETRLKAQAKQQLSDQDLSPTIDIDAMANFSDLKPSLLREMDRLEPTGNKNRSAVFASRKVYVNGARAVGKDGSHLKLILSADRITFDAIAFRFGHLVDEIPGQIDIAYAFELNEFNGRQTLQLNIKDIKL